MTATYLRNIIQKSGGKPGQTSIAIFTAAGLPYASKTSRNPIITMASVWLPLKLSPLIPRHRILRLPSAQKCMTLDTSYVLFTKDIMATFDGAGDGANVWVYFWDKHHQRCGFVSLDTEFLASHGVWNLSNDCGCLLHSPKRGLDPWLEDIPPSLLRTLIFMHITLFLSHSGRVTQTFLDSYKLKS